MGRELPCYVKSLKKINELFQFFFLWLNSSFALTVIALIYMILLELGSGQLQYAITLLSSDKNFYHTNYLIFFFYFILLIVEIESCFFNSQSQTPNVIASGAILKECLANKNGDHFSISISRI